MVGGADPSCRHGGRAVARPGLQAGIEVPDLCVVELLAHACRDQRDLLCQGFVARGARTALLVDQATDHLRQVRPAVATGELRLQRLARADFCGVSRQARLALFGDQAAAHLPQRRRLPDAVALLGKPDVQRRAIHVGQGGGEVRRTHQRDRERLTAASLGRVRGTARRGLIADGGSQRRVGGLQLRGQLLACRCFRRIGAGARRGFGLQCGLRGAQRCVQRREA
ncbi:hypothetical protein D9M72_171160 [compost metagenome]